MVLTYPVGAKSWFVLFYGGIALICNTVLSCNPRSDADFTVTES